MRKLLIGFFALFSTLPAFAGVDHWTCSNEQTVLYMVLDTTGGSFILWDDKGQYLAGAKFTTTSKTKDGVPFLAAELENGTAVGVAKGKNNTLILAIAADTESASTRFVCQ